MVSRIGVAAMYLGAALIAAPTAVPPPAFAASALYMGGTFAQLGIPEDTPESIDSYVSSMGDLYLEPTGLCTGGDPGCAPLAVYTPEQIRGVTGWRDMSFANSVDIGVMSLDRCLRALPCVVTPPPYTATDIATLTDTVYTVLGYSQSATVASIEKANLIADPPSVSVSFVLVANPNRPNGGILERFAGAFIPIVGIIFNGATATDSPRSAPLTTVDIAGQYDPIADFPTNPLNLLADLNALFGFYRVHLRPFEAGTPELQGQYQDSTYYLIPTATLPLLAPIAAIPKIGPLLAAVLDPPLRVLIEAGYDRTSNPGDPTTARVFYFPNPLATTVNVLKAIPTGWDNGIAYATGDPTNRPFGTTPPGPYGVGGPPVNAGTVDPYGPPTSYAPEPPTQISVPSAAAAVPPPTVTTGSADADPTPAAALSSTAAQPDPSPRTGKHARTSHTATPGHTATSARHRR